MTFDSKILVCLFLILSFRDARGHGPETLLATDEWGRYEALDSPSRMCRLTTGEIAVTDTGNSRVVVFGRQDGPVRVLGTIGSDPGEFVDPEGIAADGLGLVYVVDSGNHRIQVLTEWGEPVRSFPVEGRVSDLLVLPDARILVARSFSPGESLFDLVTDSGMLIDQCGKRLSPQDLGLPSADAGGALEPSLNNFVIAPVVGKPGHWITGFTSLGMLVRWSTTRTCAGVGVLTPDIPAYAEVDSFLHAVRAEELAANSRQEPCSSPNPESMARDLQALCADGYPHFFSVVSGVAAWGQDTLVLANGRVVLLSDHGEVLREWALLGAHGETAYAHVLWSDSPGEFFTIDSAHEQLIRRFVLSESTEPPNPREKG